MKTGNLLSYALIGSCVAVCFMVAKQAEAGDAVFLNTSNGYKEECADEGCSLEERDELYWAGDYDEECIGEGCHFEEPTELACPFAQALTNCGGIAQRANYWRPVMENHFCRDGRRILWINAISGWSTTNPICN